MEFGNAFQETADFILSKTKLKPELGIVLGSGLGALGEKLEEACFIPYSEIPHFVSSTAPGHKGRVIIGKLGGKMLFCMQGRVHYYEGYTMRQITYPVRIMKKIGIQTLILTNSCGGLNPEFAPGDLMVITDHINFMGQNPLIGPNEEQFGVRFPDMTKAYSRDLISLAKQTAAEKGIQLREGVYIAYSGPSFETPAEIRLFQQFGGSAVGMSTVPEAIVASHCKMKLLALSCVTNLAAGILDVPLSGEEVIEVAGKAGEKFTLLLTEIIKRIEV
jgi:purine-nucleoside phosphorylase